MHGVSALFVQSFLPQIRTETALVKACICSSSRDEPWQGHGACRAGWHRASSVHGDRKHDGLSHEVENPLLSWVREQRLSRGLLSLNRATCCRGTVLSTFSRAGPRKTSGGTAGCRSSERHLAAVPSVMGGGMGLDFHSCSRPPSPGIAHSSVTCLRGIIVFH